MPSAVNVVITSVRLEDSPGTLGSRVTATDVAAGLLLPPQPLGHREETTPCWTPKSC